MIRAVLGDTWLLLLGICGADVVADSIVRHWLGTRIGLVIPRYVYAEATWVMESSWFVERTSATDRRDMIKAIIRGTHPVLFSLSVAHTYEHGVQDTLFRTALAEWADYIITRDPNVLAIGEHRGVRIVTAEAFLREIERA